MILKINDRFTNRTVRFFDQINIGLRFDSVASTFSFNFYFDPNNPDHKDMACVGHFHEVTVEHNGELLISGYLISQKFADSNTKQMAGFAGYSKSGVIEDVNIPLNAYPIQTQGLSVRSIAQRLLSYFKIGLIDQVGLNEEIQDSKANETQTIKAYLTELTSQRDVVLSHDAKGNVVFAKANTRQAPIMIFDSTRQDNEVIPFTSMELNINGQQLHSHISVIGEASTNEGDDASEVTVRNRIVQGVFRPKVLKQTTGTDVTALKAAELARKAELRAITLTIQTDRWEIDGKVIKPNSIISVKNPNCYIYKPTKFFVESVNLVGNTQAMTATLTCVLPEAYAGGEPTIFSGINVHKTEPVQ